MYFLKFIIKYFSFDFKLLKKYNQIINFQKFNLSNLKFLYY